ncbi:MAG: proprotein convertase P-domain-containing protein, partial [Gemmataceae bacterium]
GSSAGGNWRLGIVNSGSVTGKLLNWSLTITPASAVSTSSSTTKTTTTSSAKTYTNSTSTTIASKGLTMSWLAVKGSAAIGSIQVRANATFPDDSDLYLYLISPTGKTIALDYNRGGTGANLTDTVFSESASTSIAKGKAPFEGSFLPEASLSQLNGSSAGGNWRLGIVNSGSVTGKLLNWSLTITPAA